MIRCKRCKKEIDEDSIEVEPITEDDDQMIWLQFRCEGCGATGTAGIRTDDFVQDEGGHDPALEFFDADLLDVVSVVEDDC